jgi:hypothetical protein
MPSTYEPIATTTLGTASTTITFSSIPSTYTDLRIVLTGRTNAGAGNVVTIRFNSDTATNYSWTYISGNGTTASSLRTTSATSISTGLYLTNNANISTGFVDIFSYAGSTNKTVLLQSINQVFIRNVVALWRSTSAITDITLTSSNAMEIGTTATLYGIKNA